ncbi:MAG: preprotein translocase subunit SecE [Deltaproteobacteria bacterium]|nr:MAG: preprotein translocase subunit SecE [Deltaproteobacteria bacterium]
MRQSVLANNFFNDVVDEMTRVSWPQRKETVSSAVVVVILLAISSGALLIIDTLWRAVVRGLLSL